MPLIQARVDALKVKLGEFYPEEQAILKSICLHHQRTRGELAEECIPVAKGLLAAVGADLDEGELYRRALILVDGATNRAVRMGLIVNVDGQYTFRPSADWHEYLDDAFLATPSVTQPPATKKGRLN